MASREVELCLRRDGEDVVVTADDDVHVRVRLDVEEVLRIPGELTPRRHARGRERAVDTARNLAAIGLRLADLLVPARARLLAALAADEPVLVRLRGDDFDLLALPWEAAHLDPHGPLGLVPGVRVVRELAPRDSPRHPAIPGPLRALIVVASPHGDPDSEGELGLLLAATADLPHAVHVDFLDDAAATLDALRARLEREPFHLVHLAALSRSGALLLEADDGRVAEVAPTDLADALAGARHPPPLLVLSTRCTGAALEGPGPMHAVEPLIAAGLPRVIAMQGTVDAAYAAELARALLLRLADPDTCSPAEALAETRRALEHTRRARLDASAPSETTRRGETRALTARPAHASPSSRDPVGASARSEPTPGALDPAYASPALFVASGLATCPLGQAPISPSPAPTLAPLRGFSPPPAVLGRRSLRRDLHAALARRGSRGAQLIGPPGSGVDDLAHDVLRALHREHFLVATHHGQFTPHDLAATVVDALDLERPTSAFVDPPERLRRYLRALADRDTPEPHVLDALAALLGEQRLVLVLADLAADLLPDGAPPLGLRLTLDRLARAADHGALLVLTPRSFAGPGNLLTPLVVDPLPATAAELLVRAHPVLARLPAADRRLLRDLARPRTILLADALLRTTPELWPALRDRLAEDPETTLYTALRGGLDDQARGFLDVLVYQRPVPAAAFAALLPLAGLEPASLPALIATLVDRRLLTPVHRDLWRPLRPATAHPAAHLAAAEWWRTRSAWSSHLEVLAHLRAAASTDAFTLADAMYAAAVTHGRHLAGLALCEHLAAVWPDRRDSWSARHTALERRRKPPAEPTPVVPARDSIFAPTPSSRDSASAREPPSDRPTVFAPSPPPPAAMGLAADEGANLLHSAVLRLAARTDLSRVVEVLAISAAGAHRRGDLVKARGDLLLAVEHTTTALQRRSIDTSARTLLAWALLDLADLEHSTDRESAARRCAAALELTARGAANRELQVADAVAHLRLGDILRGLRLADAEAELDLGLVFTLPPGFVHLSLVRREHALALARRGAVDLQYGRREAARERLNEAAASLARLAEHPRGRGAALEIRLHLADLQLTSGRSDDARTTLFAALDGQDGPQGDRPLDLLRWRLARTLAAVQLRRGDLADARAQLDRARAIAGPLLEREPYAPDLRHEHALTCIVTGDLLRIVDDPPAPQRWLLEAEKILAGLTASSRCRDRHVDRVRALLELAEYHRHTDDPIRARAHAESAQDLADRLGADEPARLDIQRLRAAARRSLAALALADRSVARRIIAVGEAISELIASRDPHDLDLRHDLVFWKILHAAQDPGPGGIQHLLVGHALAQPLVGRDPGRADFSRRMWAIAIDLARRTRGSDPAAAHGYLRQALTLAEDLAERHPDNDAAEADLARTCTDLAALDPLEARRLLTRAVVIQRARMSAAPGAASRTRDLAAALVELGNIEDPAAARAVHHEARALLRALGRERLTSRDLARLTWLDQRLGEA
ncbi:MAG: CHAT domain-containing protein [Myxococcales bacterium]|nr:CHAT domain-containing protein [Myxococcales bacterium]